MSAFSDQLDRLCARTLDGPGSTEPETRQAIADHASKPPELGMLGVGSTSIAVEGPVPEPVHSLLDKVSHAASRVLDSDVENARAAGLSEDELFEMIVSAALGAARTRYRIGTDLLKEST